MCVPLFFILFRLVETINCGMYYHYIGGNLHEGSCFFMKVLSLRLVCVCVCVCGV